MGNYDDNLHKTMVASSQQSTLLGSSTPLKTQLPPLSVVKQKHARASSIMDMRSDDAEFKSDPKTNESKYIDPFYEKDMAFYVKDLPKPISAATDREIKSISENV